MHISILTLAYDATSILMDHHMNFCSCSLARHTQLSINHTFGPVRKQAKEQVIYRVGLLNASSVGVRTDLVMLEKPR